MSNRIVVKADEQRLLFAEVYSPLHVDTDGEAMTAEDIRKMAHNFLASGRVTKIDVQHNQKESGCVVVESFIARKNDPDGFIKDSWVLGIHVPSDDVWEAVKKGELNGLSFFGSVQKVPARARVIVTRKMVGQTEESMAGLLPAHSHDVTINFSENGRVMEGFTERAVGHTHRITKATATETDWDHGHRLVLVENDEEEKVEKGELQFSWKPTEEESNRFVALMEEDVEKGGPGSGSWNGPGDPRFQWSRQARANRSVEESLALGEDEEGAGAISRTIGEIFKYEKDLKKRFPVVRKVLEDQERKYELTGNPYKGSYSVTGIYAKVFENKSGEPVVGSYDPLLRTIDIATEQPLEEDLQIGSRTSFCVGECLGSTFRHEVAHHLRSSSSDFPEGFRKNWNDLYAELGKAFFKKKISEYASSDADEGFAECFSAYTSPLYKKGSLPPKIEKYLNTFIGGKK